MGQGGAGWGRVGQGVLGENRGIIGRFKGLAIDILSNLLFDSVAVSGHFYDENDTLLKNPTQIHSLNSFIASNYHLPFFQM